MTRVGLGAIEKWGSSYPSSDGDTCTAGCEPRVQRRNRQEREKAQVYKEHLTDLWGTLFRTLFSTLRFTTHGSLSWDILSEFLVIPLLTWASECGRPQWRHFVFFRFLRGIKAWRAKANMVRSLSRGKIFDVARLLHSSQAAGSLTKSDCIPNNTRLYLWSIGMLSKT